MSIRGTAIAFAIAALWALPGTAHAQGVFDMGQLTVTLATDAVTQSEERRAHATPDRRKPAAAPRTPTAAEMSRLTYRPSAALTQRNIAQFAAQMKRTDPAAAAEVQRVLSQPQTAIDLRRWLKRYGMAPDNVADAVAMYLTAAWYATRGSDADPAPGEIIGVRNQFAAAMMATPAFLNASNEEKQQLAESNIIQAMLVSLYVTQAKGDAKTLAAIRTSVATGARASYGLDLLKMRLTKVGLRPG